MKRNLFFTFGILLFLGFVLISCNAQSSNKALVGEWDDGEGTVWKFFKDGSGMLIEGDPDPDKFTWTAKENGVIEFNWVGGGTESSEYKISGSVLTIDGEDYKKQSGISRKSTAATEKTQPQN